MSNSLDDISALKDDFRMQSPETSAPTSSVDVFVRIMAVIVIIAFFVLLFVIVPRAGFALNTGYLPPGANCTTCPPGPIGPSGPQGNVGPIGPQGVQGIPGNTGPQGQVGMPGPTGPMGMCLNNNPACLQGATGPTGMQGIPGPTGPAGIPGATGSIGPQGIQGFVGPTGSVGPIGVTGPTGPQGIPGICDICMLPIAEIQTLNVTTQLILSGGATCPGGSLDASCFGLSGACPDFSECYLQQRGLQIFSDNVTFVPQLRVGGIMGDVGTGVVVFGSGSYPIAGFTSYVSNQQVLESEGMASFRSLLNNVLIEASSAAAQLTIRAPEGMVTMQTKLGMAISVSGGSSGQYSVNVGAATTVMDQATGNHFITGTLVEMTATDFKLQRGVGMPWIESSSTDTLVCSPVAIPFATTTGFSVTHSEDVIIADTKKLMTNAADGLIEASGFKLCGPGIKSVASTLRLQDNTATKIISLEGTVTNAEATQPITILDLEGINFQSTPLRNDAGGEPLIVDDAEGLRVSGTQLEVNQIVPESGTAITLSATTISVTNNLDVTGVLGASVITPGGGTLTVNGDIFATGMISATGSCCTSDLRVKKNITDISPQSDLNTILKIPRRVSYQFKKEYQDIDRTVKNYVHHGFIAQEIEHILPRTVSLMNRTVGGITHTDFRTMHLDRMVPHLVGAVKQLHLEKRVLQKEHELLKASHEALLGEVRMLKDWMHSMVK